MVPMTGSRMGRIDKKGAVGRKRLVLETWTILRDGLVSYAGEDLGDAWHGDLHGRRQEPEDDLQYTRMVN